MNKKKRGTLSKEDKLFFEYQTDFYKAMKLFMDRGDILQKKQKDRGAIAPTESINVFIILGCVES